MYEPTEIDLNDNKALALEPDALHDLYPDQGIGPEPVNVGLVAFILQAQVVNNKWMNRGEENNVYAITN